MSYSVGGDTKKSVIVAIPFYRNAQLVAPLLDSLLACREELKDMDSEIFAIVDSPDDQQLIDALNAYQAKFEGIVGYNVTINPINLGFIKSVNKAFSRAAESLCDIIILNSDVVVFPNALREMRRVAYLDHMTAFVSPRSNNATICSLPFSEEFRHYSPEISHANYLAIAHSLPAFDYVPTVVGFAMFIKCNVLIDFGFFDEIFGLGYNEENDLVMRANRCGYRSVIANQAFVYHVGEQSFDLLSETRSERDKKNRMILDERYPEYAPSVQRYFDSARFQATKLLDGLVPDREGKISIAFDMRSYRKDHNGTFEAAKRIVENFVLNFKQFRVFAICKPDVFEFHNFDLIGGLNQIYFDTDHTFGAIIRIGQPFSFEDLTYVRSKAPVQAIFMLDTIAMDCQQLDTDGLELIWNSSLNSSEIILYNSEYTLNQFNNRFQISKDIIQIPTLHSTDEKEYFDYASNFDANLAHDSWAKNYILLIGNKFSHKYLKETLSFIREEMPDANLRVFGMQGQDTEVCKFLETGHLSQEEIEDIYKEASVVVFPSHYEGFGFPLMQALAHHRRVFARDMPVFREIAHRTPYADNITLFHNKMELLDLLRDGKFEWIDSARLVAPVRWKDTSLALKEGLDKAFLSLNRDNLSDNIAKTHSNQVKIKLSEPCDNIIPNLSLVIDENWKRRLRWLNWPGGEATHGQIAKELVRTSLFYDEDYYLEKNDDVRKAGVAPLDHFFEYGWLENRNPSRWFDVAWYTKSYPDVSSTGMNPLVHYLRYGIFEKRQIKFSESNEVYTINSVTIEDRY